MSPYPDNFLLSSKVAAMPANSTKGIKNKTSKGQKCEDVFLDNFSNEESPVFVLDFSFVWEQRWGVADDVDRFLRAFRNRWQSQNLWETIMSFCTPISWFLQFFFDSSKASHRLQLPVDFIETFIKCWWKRNRCRLDWALKCSDWSI